MAAFNLEPSLRVERVARAVHGSAAAKVVTDKDTTSDAATPDPGATIMITSDAKTTPVDPLKSSSYIEDVTTLGFAILVGGVGSPPHIDSLHCIASQRMRTALAMGVIIQGVKYFHAVAPRGKQVQGFRRTLNRTRAVKMTKQQLQYRHAVCHKRVPEPFQGIHSMGWPSESSWDALDDAGVPKHFHELFAGDIYIVVDGSWHCVINHPSYNAGSVAYDDRWIGSISHYEQLIER